MTTNYLLAPLQQSSVTLFDECATNDMLMLSLQQSATATNDSILLSSNSSITTSSTYYENNFIFTETIVQCISNRLYTIQQYDNQVQTEFVTWMIIITGSMVFFMQTGFAMVCAGCVRRKNLQNTMVKNILDVCITSVTYFCFGYAFSYDTNSSNGTSNKTFVGTKHILGINLENDSLMAAYFFQLSLSATCVTIVAGTVAERCQMISYLIYCVIISSFVYPIIAHSIWSTSGFLSITAPNVPLNGIGVIDFSGSGVIHLTGGTAALIASIILGPRAGRFTNSKGKRLRTPKHFPGSSIALQLFGTLTLWFGWFGFNCGTALLLPYQKYVSIVASRVACNTALAGGAGAVCALFINMYYKKERYGDNYSFCITMAMNGCLSGLVAITACCATVDLSIAVLIGSIAGCFYVAASYILIYFQIDDVVDGIPVHFVNGIWGMIATGLFSNNHYIKQTYNISTNHNGLFYSIGQFTFDVRLLCNQLVGILFIIVWTSAILIPLFVLLHYFKLFRPSSMDEVLGLDVRYNGTITAEAQEEVEEDMARYQLQQLQQEERSSKEAKRRERRSNRGTSSKSSGSVGSSIMTNSISHMDTTANANKAIKTDSDTSANTNNESLSVNTKINNTTMNNLESIHENSPIQSVDNDGTENDENDDNDDENDNDNDNEDKRLRQQLFINDQLQQQQKTVT